MTDKEKLEEAKRLYQTANADQRYVLESLFPELKEESEDERIRKAIISGMKALQEKGKYTCFANIPMDDVFTWLERQGEQTDKIVERAKTERQRVLITESNGGANIDWDTRSLQDVKLLLEYGLDYVNKLEKQGREKPADKVEPIFEVGDTMRTLQEASNGITEGTPVVVSIDNEYYRCNNETIAIKDQNNYEYPPINKRHNAWSEEDENTIKVLMNIIRKSEMIDSIIYTDSLKEKLYDWLKSLRPQPKQEWSEEDEKMLNRIIEDFSDGKVSNILEVYWLKSIKQRIRG